MAERPGSSALQGTIVAARLHTRISWLGSADFGGWGEKKAERTRGYYILFLS